MHNTSSKYTKSTKYTNCRTHHLSWFLNPSPPDLCGRSTSCMIMWSKYTKYFEIHKLQKCPWMIIWFFTYLCRYPPHRDLFQEFHRPFPKPDSQGGQTSQRWAPISIFRKQKSQPIIRLQILLKYWYCPNINISATKVTTNNQTRQNWTPKTIEILILSQYQFFGNKSQN